MELFPFLDRIVAEPVKEADRIGSFVIPESVEREKKCQARVVKSNVSDLQEGDVVVYGEFDGVTISIEGKDFLILDKDEIIGIIK